MKKVFAVVAIAVGLTACGNAKTETVSDSTAVAVDTAVVAQDTTAAPVATDSTATK